MSETKRDAMMKRVAALLAKAQSTNFAEERETYLAKADELMVKWAIEDFELAAARPAQEREKPEMRTIIITSKGMSFDARWNLSRLFTSLAGLTGVKIGVKDFTSEGYVAKVVGYRADLDYLQTLYLNLQLHFLNTMEPKFDASKSELANFTAMWEAGMDWRAIFRAMGWEWNSTTKSHSGLTGASRTKLHSMRKAYAESCKAEGREPIKGVKGDVYRESFVTGYVDRIQQRIAQMKSARTEAGYGLVLAGRADDLNEALWTEFPDLRPHPQGCECDLHHMMECTDPKCERTVCVNARKPVKVDRRYGSWKEPKRDARGYSRGSDVAKNAKLTKEDAVSGMRKKLN